MRARRATKATVPRHESQPSLEGAASDAAVDPIPPADLDELPRASEPANRASDEHDEGEPMDPRRVCLLCGDDVSAGPGLHDEGCAHAACARVLRADRALRSALERVLDATAALRGARRTLHAALTAAASRGDVEIEEPAVRTREPAEESTPPAAVAEGACAVCAARDAQVEAHAARKSERRRRPGGLPAAQTAFRFAECAPAERALETGG